MVRQTKKVNVNFNTPVALDWSKPVRFKNILTRHVITILEIPNVFGLYLDPKPDHFGRFGKYLIRVDWINVYYGIYPNHVEYLAISDDDCPLSFYHQNYKKFQLENFVP
jgi:hypothetical protein